MDDQKEFVNVNLNSNEFIISSQSIDHPNNSNFKNTEGLSITYGIDDNPPWYLCIFMALQHYLTMIGAIVSIPFILTPALCMKEDDPARGHIISTMIFVTAIVTFLQVTFGCRLPIVQGGTISFLVPTLAILKLPQWRCPSMGSIIEMTSYDQEELWKVRMRELSGAIAVSAMFQVLLGYSGLIGKLVKYVTPLTIVPTVSLVGLSLFENAAESASKHWGISMGTIILLTLFSQFLTNVKLPVPTYNKTNGFSTTKFNVFQLFPVLLTITIMWILCALLTIYDYFPTGHPARTDVKIRIIGDSSWFRVPYPGQWGWPTVSVAGVIGMLAGVLACTVESISYYPTTAKMCGAPPPPVHAINRGIGFEGLGTVFAGLMGSGNGTNTFGENVGAIGVTKIGSRRVIQYASALMLIQGVVNKFGAVFIIIPEPIVGGMFCIMFGMISAFGLSALQYVQLNSSRNLYIIGFSMFFSLVLPKWIIAHPNAIQTGNEILDSVLTVICSTSILVGGLIGCFLDNTIPGTPEERGLIAWANEMNLSSEPTTDEETSTYDFPVGMKALRKMKWTYSVPFLPTYRPKKN
ncbi:solute carrier family 23 member 2 isoform X2 [Melanaphis sacchari]|uniref:Solute carrier family 23 member 2 n=3 Tax=Melanaphis sacchari TaxID=742174 RepID=A0A2H8TTW7_9HEMI|nr:solute carrier family 23 member 2 isoform X2 [Melanaphis sacchari]XP_025197975.1 solute carrier family 23 member 2 isoform X2 [Melanaphis sacchari]